MVKMELKRLFLSGERRAELLKQIRTPRKWSLFLHRNLQLLLFRELEPLGGNSVVLTISAKAAVEVLWHSEKWNSCHRRRRRRPSSGMAAFCTNQILAKTERLESLGSQDTPKTEHQQIFKHSFQRNPQEQKIPFGYGDSFRSPLWLLSCRPLFQGQLSWRYPASTSVPCARWTGESRVFYLGRNSHFVEIWSGQNNDLLELVTLVVVNVCRFPMIYLWFFPLKDLLFFMFAFLL